MSLVAPFEEIFAEKKGLLGNHPSWERTELGNVCSVVNGFPFKSSQFNRERGFPVVRIRDLGKDRTETRYDGDVPKEALIEDGDLLIGMDGLFRCCEWKGGRAGLNQRVCKIVPNEQFLDRKFLLFGMDGYLKVIEEATSSVTVGHLSSRDVLRIPFPLPPLAEQRRIVAKLEKLLGQVDACQGRLEKIPALLKRFRQAVLAAACSGRLTADWREENHTPEPASELLARLSKERERKAAKVSDKRRVPPAPLDSDGLSDLPDFWQWATLDQIVEEGRPIIYGIIKPGPNDPHGVPYVRVFEMKDGKVAPLAELNRASPERASKFARATLKAGDLLISKDGTIGRVAIVPLELDGGNITQHLVRASVHTLLDREFIAHAIRSQHAQNWLIGEKKGVALQGVNVEDFRRLPLPIPPLPEQQEIVRRVEGLFALADQIEARMEAAQRQVDMLTPSLLARAFAGKLVPQDPADEPAEKLLERIRKEEPQITRISRMKKGNKNP
jgi:type I restriction enzyme S subunit